MAKVRVLYEPERELLTVFWQEPKRSQLCTELDNGVVLIKDETTGEPIGVELFSYKPDDGRLDSVSVAIGAAG